MTRVPRYKIRWDAGKGQYVIHDMTTWRRVNAFDRLHEAEHWICSLGADALIDLDEIVTEDAPT